MIIKNITFVIQDVYFDTFLQLLKEETHVVKDWAEDVQLLKVQEKVDPNATSIAVQLSFKSNYNMQVFTNLLKDTFIQKVQSKHPEQLLYFETHLEKLT